MHRRTRAEKKVTDVAKHDLELLAAAVTPAAPLRTYQWEGILFLLRNASALLADEMGLGKTVQTAIALQLLLGTLDHERALIVVPASLKLNWERELQRWAPSLTVRRVEGPRSDRFAAYALPIPVLIASYEQVRNDTRDFAGDLGFDAVVLDEAQRIKNPGSETALACRLLPRKIAWALTGTPVENRPEDLVSIFKFLRPGLMHEGQPRGDIHRIMREHFLRRRKAEVLGDLPPIIDQDMLLELEGAQRDAYYSAWDRRREIARARGLPVTEACLFALITRLKLLCNFEPVTGASVKLDSLMLLLDSLGERDDKVLVFSQYVQSLQAISSRIPRFPHDIYHGKMTQAEREEAIRKFQDMPGPRALLVSLKAGGVGLNLQAASTVVLFDRWWNPAVEDQAIQRAHRFGRERPLHVIRFLIRETIEERIDRILSAKRDLFEAYVNGAPNALSLGLSRDNLRAILGLSSLDADGQENEPR